MKDRTPTTHNNGRTLRTRATGQRPKPSNRAGIVSGWKAIAAYLGMGVRTVQRYEREVGLPVRRLLRGKQGSVLATKSELDAWINARPLAEKFVMKPFLPQSHIFGFEAFRESLVDQRRLRDEMVKIREDLHATVEVLRATIGQVAPHESGEERHPQISRKVN